MGKGIKQSTFETELCTDHGKTGTVLAEYMHSLSGTETVDNLMVSDFVESLLDCYYDR